MCLKVFAYELSSINTYLDKHFPADFRISDQQLTQLRWALKQNHSTFDQDLYVPQQELPIEFRRALTRLYCARLLRIGTRHAYNKFVQAQQRIANPLSFNTFNKLSKIVANLTPSDYELLETATILAAVSLSAPATELAQQVMDIQPISHDKLGFMAATLRSSLNLYPLTEKISENNNAAKKLLYIMFPPQTNFQHMLYTEGGIGMFRYLRSMMIHGYIDDSEMDLLCAYWLVNIAGFRGHVSQQGSLYLNEDVAQAVLKLQGFMHEMLEIPNYDPLLPYLEYRARILGLQDLPIKQRLFITHMGCLLRLYNVTEGQRLRACIMNLPVDHYEAAMTFFINGLQDETQSLITYAPALFGNSLALTNGNIETVIIKILPIYNKIIKHAVKNPENVVSFNNLSATSNIKALLNANALSLQRLQIDNHGNISLIPGN